MLLTVRPAYGTVIMVRVFHLIDTAPTSDKLAVLPYVLDAFVSMPDLTLRASSECVVPRSQVHMTYHIQLRSQILERLAASRPQALVSVLLPQPPRERLRRPPCCPHRHPRLHRAFLHCVADLYLCFFPRGGNPRREKLLVLLVPDTKRHWELCAQLADFRVILLLRNPAK